MSQKTSPFLQGKYGWDFGEDGWNPGMDENLLKFSYMFDRTVNGIVGVLPAPVSGEAYFLTTDNQLYFAVENTWYWTVVPKWFEFKNRSTGATYQFNGTAAVQIDSPAELETRLDAVEDTINDLGTAAFENVVDLVTQDQLDISEANTQAYTDDAIADFNTNTVAPIDAKLDTFKTLKDFGVVGDGVTDDSAAMATVAAYNGKVLGQGLTVLTNGFTITGKLDLDMEGGTIKFASALQRILINSNNVAFKNTIFDANNFNVNVNLIRIPTTYVNQRFENCTFQNIVGITNSDNQYAIYADLDGAITTIRNCTFKNISNVSDPAPVSGFCGGMLLASTSTGAKHFVVDGCLFDNIWTDNISGNINNSDADGLRVFGPLTTVDSGLHINNCTFVDIQKSAIKTSGVRGITVDNIKVYNNRSDISMIAGCRFQAADNSTISNIVLYGRMSIGLNIRAKNTIVKGVTFTPIDTARDTVAGGLIQLQSDDTQLTEHLWIDNVTGRNVGQVFDFDTSGTTANIVFQNIRFTNFEIEMLLTVSTGTTSKVNKASNITLQNIHIRDGQAALINCMDFNSVQALRVINCTLPARRELFSWTPGVLGCLDIEFNGCRFVRPNLASTENFVFMLLRDTALGALDRVRVKNCFFSIPSYTASSNQDTILANITNGEIDNVNIFVRNVSTNVPGRFINCSTAVNSRISNIKVSSEAALTVPAGVGYAVILQSGSLTNIVSCVHNSASRGVQAVAGANNNLLDTVAAKLNAISDVGTGNVSGSQIVLP